MTKKVTMKMPVQKTDAAEAWVAQTTVDVSEAPKGGKVVQLREPAESIKRLTIDLPESLHKRIKTQCAMRGVKMTEIIRELMEREFPA